MRFEELGVARHLSFRISSGGLLTAFGETRLEGPLPSQLYYLLCLAPVSRVFGRASPGRFAWHLTSYVLLVDALELHMHNKSPQKDEVEIVLWPD